MNKVNVAILPKYNLMLDSTVEKRKKEGNLNNTKTRVLAELIEKAYKREEKG